MSIGSTYGERAFWRDMGRKYPLIGFDSDIRRMKKEFETRPGGFMCGVVEKYIDDEMVLYIFIWSYILNSQYVYFVIAPGHIWTPAQEALFHKYVLMNEKAFLGDYISPALGWRSIYEKFKARYPDLKLKYYENQLRTIERIYYVTHSCPEKILYDSDLDEIAFQFADMEGCNLSGKTASELLDDLPENVLRKMNSRAGFIAIRTYLYRKYLMDISSQYSHIFMNGLTISQAMYFSEVICDLKAGEYDDDDILTLNFLADKLYEYDYNCLMGYLEKREIVRTFMDFPRIPCLDNYDMYDKMDSVIAYLEHQEAINKAVANARETLGRQLEYQGKGYKVVCPYNAQEILLESNCLNNFAWSYWEQICAGNGMAMFLAREGSPDKTEVIFFVKDREILQALGRCNADLTEEQFQWIRNYAKEKDLNIMFD